MKSEGFCGEAEDMLESRVCEGGALSKEVISHEIALDHEQSLAKEGWVVYLMHRSHSFLANVLFVERGWSLSLVRQNHLQSSNPPHPSPRTSPINIKLSSE